MEDQRARARAMECAPWVMLRRPKTGCPDTRIHGVHGSAPYSSLLPGPFQLTNSTSFPDDSYAASPVHRFYQMWQQFDCNASYATTPNPSGCKADLIHLDRSDRWVKRERQDAARNLQYRLCARQGYDR